MVKATKYKKTGDGPPTKMAKVTLDKGTVSQAIAMDFVKALLSSSVEDDQLYGLQMLTKQLKTGDSDECVKLTEARVLTHLVRLLTDKNSRAQVK